MPKKFVVAQVILAPDAQQDLKQVLKRSEQKFGKNAAERYRSLVKQAIQDVAADPNRPGSRERSDLVVQGARTYHLSFSRSRISGSTVKELRHLLLYRRLATGVLEVARILHDSFDLRRHLPESYRRSGTK